MSVIKLFCEEHGHVLTGGITRVSGFEFAEMTFFCPRCNRELLPEGETRKPHRSQASFLEHYDGDILRLPLIRLDDDEADR